jgi:hypothetical protein
MKMETACFFFFSKRNQNFTLPMFDLIIFSSFTLPHSDTNHHDTQ